MPGSTEFHAALKLIGELHDRKQADYGRESDPFSNVRGSEDFGILPWVGALVRANDKMRRLQKVARGGALVNESVEDSMLDLAVYALISYVLYQEGEVGKWGTCKLDTSLHIRGSRCILWASTR